MVNNNTEQIISAQRVQAKTYPAGGGTSYTGPQYYKLDPPSNVSITVGSLGITFPTTYDMETQLLCEPSPSTNKVLAVFTKLSTAAPGTAPTANFFNYPAMTAYGGAPSALVQCGSIETAYVINAGTYDATGLFTQATLPGIAAGGKLQSMVIVNTGGAPMTFTGGDANAVSIPAGGYHSWTVDDSADQLGNFSANATGTTARVVYTYR